MSPEQYAKMHKDAFRCAFDYLNKHFPPGDTPEWWDQMARDAASASVSQGDNLLAMELLIGVCNYLDKECIKRRDNNGETDD